MTATETALRAESLVKEYGTRRALQGVSFEAAAGELVAVIGPNGAGKTTLLQILAGALKATSGTVSLDRREVGWVPQQPAVYRKLSVVENLRLFARLESVDDVPATVARMLEQTGLADRADDAVGTLSGGNQQRVNIAVGLLGEPRLLLLDEPSSHSIPASASDCGSSSPRWRARTPRLSSTPRTTSPRRSAMRTACSCSPTVSCSSPARPTSSSVRPASTRARLRGRVRAVPAGARPLMRWLLAKDLRILRRSPLLVALLVLYPLLVALLVGAALSSGPSKPKVAFANLVPPGRRRSASAASNSTPPLTPPSCSRTSIRSAWTRVRRRSRRSSPGRRSARS